MSDPEIRAKLNEQTRQDWRELGFFYDYDKQEKLWRLIGSNSGLIKFCDLLDAYVADKRNEKLSEHEHYGPYMYLEIMTWNEAAITDHAIQGQLNQLRSLSQLCRNKLMNARIGDRIIIDSEYSDKNTASLSLEIRPDDFDPPSIDPELK